MERRPDFIKHFKEIQNEDKAHYPNSEELLCITSDFGRKLGLTRIGVGVDVLPPGRRTSWPHAHSHEEEFIYVVSGHPKVWVDGETYELNPGDGVGFPPGTGISHTFINDSEFDVVLLVVGEQRNSEDHLVYPLHPHRQQEIKKPWVGAPARKLGPHDGKPQLRVSNE